MAKRKQEPPAISAIHAMEIAIDVLQLLQAIYLRAYADIRKDLSLTTREVEEATNVLSQIVNPPLHRWLLSPLALPPRIYLVEAANLSQAIINWDRGDCKEVQRGRRVQNALRDHGEIISLEMATGFQVRGWPVKLLEVDEKLQAAIFLK